jgi:hypothetical protein
VSQVWRLYAVVVDAQGNALRAYRVVPSTLFPGCRLVSVLAPSAETALLEAQKKAAIAAQKKGNQ